MLLIIAGLFKEGHGGGEGVSGYQGCKEMFYLEVSEDWKFLDSQRVGKGFMPLEVINRLR